MVKRKLKVNILRKVLIVIFSLVSIGLLFNVYKDYSKNTDLRNDLKEAQAKLEVINNENSTLTEQKEKLNDDAYVQSYARANYMLSKDGEKVFYLPETEK
jgi:cell division protein DivIC